MCEREREGERERVREKEHQYLILPCTDPRVLIGASIGTGVAMAILSVTITVVITYLCNKKKTAKFPEDKSHRCEYNHTMETLYCGHPLGQPKVS